MTWSDIVSVAAKGIVRRLGRTVLTIMAVALAAALLSALLIIVQTGQSRVLEQISKGGPLASITVQGSRLDTDYLAKIRALAGVRSVVPIAEATEVVVPPVPPTFSGTVPTSSPTGTASPGARSVPGHSFGDGVVGVDLHHPGLFPITVLAGRLPSPDSRTEVAVTAGYLEHVGVPTTLQTGVLGTQIELGAIHYGSAPTSLWHRATIVGVVAQDAGSGDILEPIDLVLRAVRFHVVGVDALTQSSTSTDIHYAAAMVEARTLDGVTALRSKISGLGLDTIASETLIANVQRYTHVIEIVLSSVGAIALLIAAIGIANALFAAVRERRREIGVLKAIGARDRDIRRLFFVEASLVGVIGGMVGGVFGWVMARATVAFVDNYLVHQGLAPVSMVFPLGILAATVVGATLLALVAGAVPAGRAAALPAAEAMGGV